jgi:zeta-carotene desaturase
LRTSVEAIVPEVDGSRIESAGNSERFRFAVLAVPYQGLDKLLPSRNGSRDISSKLHSQISRFESSPITGIHLWFDRTITELPHAALLDRTIQWMFQKSKLQPQRSEAEAGSYIELVVSSSRSLIDQGKQEIIDLAMRELAEFFPLAKTAKLVKSTVIKELNAGYSALPGSESYRPDVHSPWPHIYLAGDWVATGWPATMEGAVRSGYRAAEVITQAARTPKKFCVPDLPSAGLMKLFG